MEKFKEMLARKLLKIIDLMKNSVFLSSQNPNKDKETEIKSIELLKYFLPTRFFVEFIKDRSCLVNTKFYEEEQTKKIIYDKFFIHMSGGYTDATDKPNYKSFQQKPNNNYKSEPNKVANSKSTNNPNANKGDLFSHFKVKK